VKADPSEVLVIDLPEWRIVDDATWFAVNERFTTREPTAGGNAPRTKYPLRGLAKCATCGGAARSSITSSSTC